MHKNLIIRAFQKAKEDRIKNGDNEPSKTNQSKDIADYLEEQFDWKISPERLKQYLYKATDINNKKEDIKIPRRETVDGLCNFLGFSSYTKFKMSTASTVEKIKYFLSKNKTTLFISIITVIICLFITITSGQRWMTWDGQEYVEVSFNIEKLESGHLKVYDADKIRNFKKVTNPDCNTDYLNKKGEKITWYFKHGKNNLEIFTAPGLHPTNGKTLKPISTYMIREHICPDF